MGKQWATAFATSLRETINRFEPMFQKKQKCNSERQTLYLELEQAKQKLDTAHTNYEFMKSDACVDYYIYEMKAAETRYQYLLKQIRELDDKADGPLHIFPAGISLTK